MTEPVHRLVHIEIRTVVGASGCLSLSSDLAVFDKDSP